MLYYSCAIASVVQMDIYRMDGDGVNMVPKEHGHMETSVQEGWGARRCLHEQERGVYMNA